MSVFDCRGPASLPGIPPTEVSVKVASERLRIAIVGLNFGKYVVQSLLDQPSTRAQIDLCMVCDQDKDRANAVANSAGTKACYDLEQVLSDPSIEAVGLFTGPSRRAELVRRIIRAGKHVMTTKPFELDPIAAMAVLKEAKSLGKVIHLNSPSPLLPADLRQIRIWEKQYNLGRPIGCRRSVWASYREQADGTWYDDPQLCPVAPIFRLGIYCINDMVRLFGQAERVSVACSRIFTGRPTPDNAQLTMQFKNGAIGTVFASFCVNDGQSYSNSMTLNFENGTIYRNLGPMPEGEEKGGSRMSVVARVSEKELITEHAVLDESSGDYQWDAFVRAARGEPLIDEVTPEEIVAGIRIINAMARSERSMATEKVD